MADEESVLDTVAAAVNEQKAEKPQVEPGPQITAPEKEEPRVNEPKADEQTEEPEGETEGRGRDASGRFKAKEAQSEVDRPSEDKPEEPKEVSPDSKPDISRPPRRVPLKTKQNWLALPEWAREDIHAREAETDKGFKRYEGCAQFATKAEQNGTNLHQALTSYHGMETAIRQDPIAGYIQVLQAARINPDVVFQEIFRRMNGPQPGQDGPTPPPPPIQGPQGMTRQEAEQWLRERDINRDIDIRLKAFEETHPLLEPLIDGEPLGPVRAAMAGIMYTRKDLANDLETAYSMSCRANGLDPGGAASGKPNGLDQKAAAVAKSRQAAKATIGAPPQGSNAGSKAPDTGNQTVLDTVRAAVIKARGG